MSDIKVSIVIPSYNETEKVKKEAIDVINEYMKKQDYTYEVLIVDDESTNGTREIIKDYIRNKKNFKLLENGHGGKAITVMTGMIKSLGEVAIFTDMDQATPIDQVSKLLPKFEEGFDIVIGSRKGRKGAPLIRKVAAVGFATMRNLILGLPFKDTQCGFKGFNRKAVDLVFPDLLEQWQAVKAKGAAVNAGFDVETLYIAKKRDLKIAEVDVEWHHVTNEKQVQMVQDSIEAIKDMLRTRLNDLSGKYN